MRRLQAESAARHGVLVESLSGLETVRATGAEARMQTAWERSVAATARSGEDVHFWSSLSLTSANPPSRSPAFSGGHRCLSHPGRQADGRRAGCRQHAGRPRARAHCRDCLGDHPRDPDFHGAQGDRPHHVAGARALAGAHLRCQEDRRGADRFRERDVSPIRTRRATRWKRSLSRSRAASGSASSVVSDRARPQSDACCSDSMKPRKAAFSIDGVDFATIRSRGSANRHRFCDAGHRSVFRQAARQYRPWQARGHRRRDSGRGATCPASRASSPVIRWDTRCRFPKAAAACPGGQKQAIGLARVLIRKPRVLFLDEPTAHFDIRSEAEFLERLKAHRDERMTIIVSTHRLSLLNMVDRLLLFDNGRLVADGPRDKVLAILQGKPAAAGSLARERDTTQICIDATITRGSTMPPLTLPLPTTSGRQWRCARRAPRACCCSPSSPCSSRF